MDTTIITTEQQSDQHIGNTLEKGIRGEYNFSVGDNLSEAWQKIHGLKAPYWKGLLLVLVIILAFFLAAVAISFGVGVIAGVVNASAPTLQLLEKSLGIVFQLIYPFITAPLVVGIMMLSIKHLMGIPALARSVLGYFYYWKKLWVMQFILVVFSLLITAAHNYAWLVLPLCIIYIYLAVSYFLFPLLIVGKKLTVWQALEASRKAVGHHWFKVAGLMIVWILICLISMLTFGILFIWTLPMINNSGAILYREIFGIDRVSASEIV